MLELPPDDVVPLGRGRGRVSVSVRARARARVSVRTGASQQRWSTTLSRYCPRMALTMLSSDLVRVSAWVRDRVRARVGVEVGVRVGGWGLGVRV